MKRAALTVSGRSILVFCGAQPKTILIQPTRPSRGVWNVCRKIGGQWLCAIDNAYGTTLLD